MDRPTVSEIVHATEARFVRCQGNQLWYAVTYTDTLGQVHRDWQFPIPFADTVGGTFLASDKPIFFMHWIRIQLAALEDET